MSGVTQLSGVESIPGKPIDPALGLPVAVFRAKPWEPLGELVGGIGLVVIGVLWLLSVVNGNPKAGPWPAAFLCIGGGPVVAWDGWRRLSRHSCVVVARNGFDDRSGSDPAGPVLWREVDGMTIGYQTDVRIGAKFASARQRKQLEVKLKPVPRQPLSALGSQPKKVENVAIILENLKGGDGLPDLMWSAYQRWQQDEAQWARQ